MLARPSESQGSIRCVQKRMFYNFLYLDIGKSGRNSDGSVINQTEFYHRLQMGTLNLPAREDTLENMFVADDALH